MLLYKANLFNEVYGSTFFFFLNVYSVCIQNMYRSGFHTFGKCFVFFSIAHSISVFFFKKFTKFSNATI